MRQADISEVASRCLRLASFGPVLGLGGVAAFVQRAQMAGHALADVEAFGGLSSESDSKLVLHRLIP